MFFYVFWIIYRSFYHCLYLWMLRQQANYSEFGTGFWAKYTISSQQVLLIPPALAVGSVITANLENHDPIFALIEQYVVPAVQTSL